MLNFNIKFVKTTKKQATTNMLNLKKNSNWAIVSFHLWKPTIAPIYKKKNNNNNNKIIIIIIILMLVVEKVVCIVVFLLF